MLLLATIAVHADNVMTRHADGTYIVRTNTICNNLKISKAKKLAERTEVDGCTGATFSTKAVQKNIKAAIGYYEKNK